MALLSRKTAISASVASVTRPLSGLALAAALMSFPAFAAAQTDGSAQLKYKINATVHASVVPNYQTGFGPSSANSGQGSGSTPAPGSSAVLDGGNVDFGTVVVGYSYLYKYAAQVSVTTNDSAGFIVYGEGATDLNSSSGTFPLANTLFWLPSNSSNNDFTSATSFESTTTGTAVSGGAGGITYSGAPPASAMIWSSPTSGTQSRGYDYELRLSSALPTSTFNVYIVYTVIGN
jgi:hypothetical protein